MDLLEEIAAASEFTKWWQLYVFTDRGLTEELLHRVHAARYGALCFTVDFPVGGLRHRDTRSGFDMPQGLPEDDQVYDHAITWDDLAWIRERAPLPLLVKGIMTAEDAVLAMKHGADGIVVSNHGGRQLDGVMSSARALPGIADAVGDKLTVLADGGVRSGLDVVRMLALGAKGVLIGRAWVYALASGGQKHLDRALSLIEAEMRVAMSLTGCKTLAEIDRTALA
jgi:L-lactate dehydrogenase (cytochrome)